MATLRFAIVGGADPQRKYDVPVDVELAHAAARAVGAELARRGHGLVVYDANFIEAQAVEGYLATNARVERAILVRQPHLRTSLFPQEGEHSRVFQRHVDTSDLWEVSFYRSLSESDGVVLIGGGYSTLNAGQVAIGARIPILALEKTGGSALVVWKTISPGIDLPGPDEHARMSLPLTDEAVRGWVGALEEQRRRRYAVESGPIRWHAFFAAVLFLVGLLLALGSHVFPVVPEARLGLLVCSMALAGAAGAAVRMVFERRYGSGPLTTPSLAVTLALGMMAGALAGLLYLVAQPGDLDLQVPSAVRFVSIVVVVSVVGGLTAESVFRKLLGIDVVRTRTIAVAPDAPGPAGPPASS